MVQAVEPHSVCSRIHKLKEPRVAPVMTVLTGLLANEKPESGIDRRNNGGDERPGRRTAGAGEARGGMMAREPRAAQAPEPANLTGRQPSAQDLAAQDMAAQLISKLTRAVTQDAKALEPAIASARGGADDGSPSHSPRRHFMKTPRPSMHLPSSADRLHGAPTAPLDDMHVLGHGRGGGGGGVRFQGVSFDGQAANGLSDQLRTRLARENSVNFHDSSAGESDGEGGHYGHRPRSNNDTDQSDGDQEMGPGTIAHRSGQRHEHGMRSRSGRRKEKRRGNDALALRTWLKIDQHGEASILQVRMHACVHPSVGCIQALGAWKDGTGDGMECLRSCISCALHWLPEGLHHCPEPWLTGRKAERTQRKGVHP